MLKALFWEKRIGKCIPRMKNKFDSTYRCYDKDCSEKAMTVRHIESGLEIQSPKYNPKEKTDQQMKKELWELMKKAIEIFKL